MTRFVGLDFLFIPSQTGDGMSAVKSLHLSLTGLGSGLPHYRLPRIWRKSFRYSYRNSPLEILDNSAFAILISGSVPWNHTFKNFAACEFAEPDELPTAPLRDIGLQIYGVYMDFPKFVILFDTEDTKKQKAHREKCKIFLWKFDRFGVYINRRTI